MNVSQIKRRVGKATKVRKMFIDIVIKAFINIIVDSILRGEEVKITGLATFSINYVGESNFYNPQTGKVEKMPPRFALKIVPSRTLKQKISEKKVG